MNLDDARSLPPSYLVRDYDAYLEYQRLSDGYHDAIEQLKRRANIGWDKMARECGYEGTGAGGTLIHAIKAGILNWNMIDGIAHLYGQIGDKNPLIGSRRPFVLDWDCAAWRELEGLSMNENQAGKGGRAPVRLGSDTWALYPIAQHDQSRFIQPYLGVNPPTDMFRPYRLHHGQEFVLVRSGRLAIDFWGFEHEETVLTEGDYLFFDSSHPHRYRGLDIPNTKVLIVCSNPFGVSCEMLARELIVSHAEPNEGQGPKKKTRRKSFIQPRRRKGEYGDEWRWRVKVRVQIAIEASPNPEWVRRTSGIDPRAFAAEDKSDLDKVAKLARILGTERRDFFEPLRLDDLRTKGNVNDLPPDGHVHRRSHSKALDYGHIKHVPLFHKRDLAARGGRLFPHIMIAGRDAQGMPVRDADAFVEPHVPGDEALEFIYVLKGNLGFICECNQMIPLAREWTKMTTVWQEDDAVLFNTGVNNVLRHGYFGSVPELGTSEAQALHLLYSLGGAPASYEREDFEPAAVPDATRAARG